MIPTRSGFLEPDELNQSTNYFGTVLHKHDSRGNLKHTTDREGSITTRKYDGMNRLREVIYGYGTSAQTTVKYDLDKNSRLTKLTDDNNNETDYGYDAVNRRTLETLEDSTYKQYTFDSYGMLSWSRDNNISQITYSYDNALRLTGKTIARGSGVEGTTQETFTHDGLARMTGAANYDGGTLISSVSLDYDSLNNRGTCFITLNMNNRGTCFITLNKARRYIRIN